MWKAVWFLLGLPLVLAPLAAAVYLHLQGQKLLPRVCATGALLIGTLWFQHWSLWLGTLLIACYWVHLRRSLWWLVEIGWRKESSELIARLRGLYYVHTGDLRYASVASPLPKVQEPEAMKVTVTRTCRETMERLQVLPSLELVQGHPQKGEVTLVLDPSVTFQEFMGFGTSFTESSCQTLLHMGSASQERIVDAYFHPETGLGFNMGRLHMNSCDFSDGNWSCCEDEDLSKLSVDRYDEAILPVVRRAFQSTRQSSPLRLFASPWSPPKWMKDSGNMCQGGKLKQECRSAWAQFYVRFAELLKEKGHTLWGFSVQNEPDGQTPWENCLYSPTEERDFIRDHLGPALEQSGLDLKLIAWDHNRDDLFLRAHTIYSDPEAAKYVWGMGWHWYGDPRYEWWADAAGQACFENVRKVHELRPEKHLLVTETCQECGAHLGDWSLAERYAESIIKDFNNWCEAWVDWNFLLTLEGGPNHVGNHCSAPVLADLEKDRVIFNPSYFAFGHFSRYIHAGAKRVLCASNRDCLEVTAFLNPDRTLVAVVLNQTKHYRDMCLLVEGKVARCGILPHSINTFSLKLSE